MNEIILDGREFTSKKELHEILKSKLKLPDYYGNNLDALWDCLTTDVELPMTIEWINFSNSKELLGEYAEQTKKVFMDASDFLEEDLNITIN
ncbi:MULTISPECIES: barstar family protein [Clostridium]|uniref:Barstar family protein n=1 Tax=Clostridium cibarium TaxID=2762247 RepID=A0ABR8PTQ7_9CLOT|nr:MULTISPECIES: barstar family protein [Clostridium]MBD7911554.1 barstar family protein [Clostridium cibarium]